MSQNNIQARVVDAILSTHVRGYKQSNLVGHVLFPTATVEKSGGTRIEFGKESFRLVNARRAPGSATKRVTSGYEGKKYALTQDSLEAPVPIERMREATGVPGADLGKIAVGQTTKQLQLALEKEQADLATDAANYDANHKVTLTGTTQWSHADSTPIDDIDTGKEQVRKTIGLDPNTLVISKPVFNALRRHATIMNYFAAKDNAKAVINEEMLAEVFDIDQVVVGKAVFADEDGAFNDVWGSSAVLAYVPTEASSIEEPSYGYTYTMTGHPFVEEPYYEKTTKSWIYGNTYERSPEIVGSNSGYLFIGAV